MKLVVTELRDLCDCDICRKGRPMLEKLSGIELCDDGKRLLRKALGLRRNTVINPGTYEVTARLKKAK